MKPDDFFHKQHPLDYDASFHSLNEELVEEVRRGDYGEKAEVDVAAALARLVHDDLESYGTGGGERCDAEGIRLCLLGLKAVLKRMSVEFSPPFRDYQTFRSYWLAKGASGSYQTRRDLLDPLFNPVHDQLADIEFRSFESDTAQAVSPHARTGWPRVDAEVSELRRHFTAARTEQDYRNVGNDCVAVTEALSATVYDQAKHLRAGETVPPVDKTKQRIERYVEDAVPGQDNAKVRKHATATIELAQAIKHQSTPTRRDAGIAADSVIMLANILKRLEQQI